MIGYWKVAVICLAFLGIGFMSGIAIQSARPAAINKKYASDSFKMGWAKGLNAKVTFAGDQRVQDQIKVGLIDQFTVDSVQFLNHR